MESQSVQGLNVSAHWYLADSVAAFLIDRQSQHMSPGTLRFYRVKMRLWLGYCEVQVIQRIDQVTPELIRAYLIHLEETGHNPGGIHAAYRVVATFLRWWEAEYDERGWRNPIRKVKPPKVPRKILEPVDLDCIRAILKGCKGRGFHALRDRAIILMLCDTGARAAELLALDVTDLDWMTGEVTIRKGKGGKPRWVYLGQRSRRALRAYIRLRPAESEAALWVTEDGHRLTYWGLRGMFKRRAGAAGVPEPSRHGFRRFYARSQLDAGVNVYTLRDLLGHADMQMPLRYLKENKESLRKAQEMGSPSDRENL